MDRFEERILITPSVAECQNKEVIEAIASVISHCDEVTLLDVAPSPSMNRTSFNILGNSNSVLQAAISVARITYQLIDIASQTASSVKPILGAMDSCPFIPIKNATLDDCAELAYKFATLLVEEFNVPVYMYGAAAKKGRENFLDVFRMEDYEELEEKIKLPDWMPDYGPAEFSSSWGAAMVGARNFLINFSVNIIGTKDQASKIASNLRESGQGDDSVKPNAVQAIGWFNDENNVAQISTSLTDDKLTPIYKVYEEVEKYCQSLNIAVVGSQLFGLVPLNSIMDCAEYYMEKDKLFILEDDQKIMLVIQRLGLSSVKRFNPKERIIEYLVDDELQDNLLMNLSMRDFVAALANRNSTPGATAVVATAASMGAALSCMCGHVLRSDCATDQSMDAILRAILPMFYQAYREYSTYIDELTLHKYNYLKIRNFDASTSSDNGEKTRLIEKVLHRAILSCQRLSASLHGMWPNIVQLCSMNLGDYRLEMKIALRAFHFAQNGLMDLVEDCISKSSDSDCELLQIATELRRCAEVGQSHRDKCIALLQDSPVDN